ncbi:MAG: signal peptidase I [Treponema sp.]|nr:signal peptidase I [Treponema sp.]
MEKNIYAISYKLRKELYHRILSITGIILLFFVIVSLFMTFIIFPVVNRSDSMAPDIPSGSCEFVTPLLKTPGRGDVILMLNYRNSQESLLKRIVKNAALFVSLRKWHPFEETPSSGTRPVIRRVVGLPGDTIYIDRYVVFVKPENQSHFLTEFEVTESKYNAKILVPPAGWDTDFGAKSSIEPVTLGPDEYFVLGDDRLSSSDSRIWGPVNKSEIIGKVLMLYFPFSKFKLF